MKIFAWVFSIVGTLLLAIGLAAYINTRAFMSDAVETEGVVLSMVARRSDDGYTYAPEVEFRDGTGQTHVFVSSSSSSPPRYRQGDAVQVLYKPADPNRARVKDFISQWMLALIFSLMGLIFAGIGYSLLIARIRRQRLIRWLKRSGRRVMAEFYQTTVNTSITVNGRNPLVVQAQWRDPHTGELVLMKSDNLWIDQGHEIPQQIPAYVNPDDPRQHFLEIV